MPQRTRNNQNRRTERERREDEALRANLLRRKAQARAREASEADGDLPKG